MNIDHILKQIEGLSPKAQIETCYSALREVFLNDFYLFAKYGLGYKDMTWFTHGETIQTLECDATRKLVILPRGTFKSSLACVAYPMWRLQKDPNLTILLDSEVYNNSKNFLREIRTHLESERFTKIFGEQVGSRWGESEIIVKGRTHNRKEASITVGGIGTVKVGQHYDICLGDDYNSPRNSETPEKCQKVIDHVRYNLNILNPKGEYVWIGTRYAERDISGWILKDILGENDLADGKMRRYTPIIKEEDNYDFTL